MAKKLFIIAFSALLPFVALAANDVVITAPVNLDFLTSDTAQPSEVRTGSSGQADNLDVESNHTDITLESGSSLTLSAITPSTYLEITKISGSNAYLVSPTCPTTTASITGSGASVVLRLETVSTDNCTSTSTPPPPPPPPAPSGGGGIPTPEPTSTFLAVPPSVSGFSATQDGRNALLSWNNPSGGGFAGVRIVRSTSFYPVSPTDGTLVYQGPGSGDLDPNLSYGITYYYAAFAYDSSGDYSGAALAAVYLAPPAPPATTTKPSLPSSPPAPSGNQGGTSTTPVIPSGPSPATSTPAAPVSTSSNAYRFAFSQSSTELMLSSTSTIAARAGRDLAVSVEVVEASSTPKTFILRITNPQKEVSAYALSPDASGKVFGASISDLSQSGDYAWSITSYDADNRPIAERSGIITATKPNYLGDGIAVSLAFPAFFWWIIWKREEEEVEEKLGEEIGKDIAGKI